MGYRVLAFAHPWNVEAALESPADGVVFELADERLDAPAARLWVREAAASARVAGKLVAVRVNHPRTRLLRDDLEAIISTDLDAVLLPHTTEPQDVRDAAVLLREFEHGRAIEPGAVALFPVIDTARGLLRAAEIAAAAPRVRGLVFDGHHYALDIGARNEEWGPRLAYARGSLVAAARAADGLPLVLGEGTECRPLAHYGFAGIVLTSLAGAATAVAAFAPTERALERAREEVDAYEAARAEGAWVARLHGAVVDGHAARKARQVVGG